MTSGTPTAATAPSPAAPAAPVEAAIGEFVPLLRALGRTDLVERMTAASARLKRPSTIVCVVGEFKQGKSSLVNGLLGSDVCPVDDDLATSAITLVRYGDEPSAVVRRKEGDEAVAENVPIADLSQWCSERGNPGNHKGVQRVEIAVPSAMLKQGLMIVDTPGMGGLGAGHAAATLAFLPFSDGLVLVSDASAELSAPEIEFMRRAVDLCPTVLFALTKIDLYPAWPKIFDLNRGHLTHAGLDVPMVAMSSTLRQEALARKDRDLNQRSRFPELISEMSEKVVGPAKEQAAERSARDVRAVATLVRGGLEQERELLADPKRIESVMQEFSAAKERLEHLRGPGAKWAQLLSDRVAEVNNRITHNFRGAMREILRDVDARIETLKGGNEWDEVVRDLQTQVANAVTDAFVEIEAQRQAIHAEIVDLLQDEDLGMSAAAGGAEVIDVRELWQDKPIDEVGSRGGRAFKTGLTGIRGAQSGVMMFGMMGTFLPATIATLMASNPVLLGAGAIFGGMQLAEDRKRKITMRRQGARQQLRQFVDDVQFEVGDQLAGAVRDLQRSLRDEFSERLTELQRTYTETAQRAQESVKKSQEEQQQRSAELQQQIQALNKIEAAVGGGRS